MQRNLTFYPNDYDDWLVLDESGADVTPQANLAYFQLIRAWNDAVSANFIYFSYKYRP